jgi:ribonuclease HI
MLKDHTDGQIKSFSSIVLHADGGCEPRNPGGVATAAWVAFDCEGNRLAEEGRIVADGGPNATNNYAEYCALGFALRWLSDQGYRGDILVKSDSKLLVHQTLDEWRCNKKHLQVLRARIWQLLKGMGLYVTNQSNRTVLVESKVVPPDQKFCTLVWVPREQNECADALGRQAYDAYLRTRPKDKPLLSRNVPASKPKKQAKPGEARFKCTVCDHQGTVRELRVEDGEFLCPICQCPIEFI